MINSKEKINKLIKIVDNARKSGNVLVEVDQDGKVKVRSEKQAIVNALAKKSNERKLFAFSITISSLVGLVLGMLIIGSYQYYKNNSSNDDEAKFSLPVSKVESELLTELITELENNDSSALENVNPIQLNEKSNKEKIYKDWEQFINSLPDSYPVIVAGVYIGEVLAFKAYERLSSEVRTVLLVEKSETGGDRILLSAVKKEDDDFKYMVAYKCICDAMRGGRC